MAEYLDEIPAAKVVSLRDIYRVIAGHSYYHGDGILAALTCIAEGKEVNPVRPADVAPVVYGRWGTGRFNLETGNYEEQCTRCRNFSKEYGKPYCPNCGAKMDGGDSDAKSV